MNRFDKDFQALTELRSGEHADININEEGGAEVWRTTWGFIVYEIPQYGGVAGFYEHVKTVEEVLYIAYEVFI